MNGYEVARKLREAPENGSMLVAAVTGYGASEDRQRSAEAGMDAHLVKPLDIDALQDMILSRQGGGSSPSPSR
jgi:CheY-like chemotaxis protein